MPETLKRLNATDCFDYFMNNFDSIQQEESKFKDNTNLDPDLKHQEVYLALKKNYLNNISQMEEDPLQIKFSRAKNAVRGFIIATLTNSATKKDVVIEINRGESAESVERSYANGRKTLRENYASSVYEMKKINHQ